MNDPASALRAFALRMPKAELHVHLEGSIRPATLLRLARRRGVALPADDEAGLARWFRFRDFDHFVEVFLTCSSCLREPEDFHLLALDFLEEQARQNVLWSEVHFTIGTHAAAGADPEAVRSALAEAVAEGERRWGVGMGLIPDVVRNVPVERADLTLEWALAGLGRGVVALGLAGVETGYPAAPFRRHFREAARRGLHRVAHAGEQAGPESVRETLEVCRPERLGHGVRSVEDPELVAEIARRRLPLEVCPSSNVCLGVVPDLASHPFDRLRRAGVRLTVGSDDPPFFGTSLSEEYARLATAFDYDPGALAGLSLESLAVSFLPEGERRRLEELFRSRFAALGEELYGSPVEP